MRVVVVAEYYPREHDPVLGIWAHRQAMAARDAGADVRVVVLNRVVPSKKALKSASPRELTASIRHPLHRIVDGLQISYVPFFAPARNRTYGSWGSWAAPPLALALRRLKQQFPFDLIHAHYAAPVGDAVRRTRRTEPLAISVHGGDILTVPYNWPKGRANVGAALGRAKLVLANSSAMAQRSELLGAKNVRVVHLGTDVPDMATATANNDLVTVSHLIERKRHIDVLHALALLADEQPNLRWKIIGDGPERANLAQAAAELGVSERVQFCGQLAPKEAVAAAQRGKVFVLPSVDEAFGVAYIEAMAGGVPVIGCAGEDGPQEITATGGGMQLVEPRNPESIAQELRRLLKDPETYAEASAQARATVVDNFTWDKCGEKTVAAYKDALKR